MSIESYAVIIDESVYNITDADIDVWKPHETYPTATIVGLSSYTGPISVGTTYKDNQFIFPSVATISVSEAYKQLRTDRSFELSRSDWTQGADVPVGIKTAWQPYRQSLRDLPSNVNDSNVVEVATNRSHSLWPTKPS
tara:strand:- start:38 stop:451 length:414 start_codon:yes stop_codon:yes gene_type:complete